MMGDELCGQGTIKVGVEVRTYEKGGSGLVCQTGCRFSSRKIALSLLCSAFSWRRMNWLTAIITTTLSS